LVSRPKKELREDAIELRRNRVLELTSQGCSQRQIENMLQVSHGTVNNNQMYLIQRLKRILKTT
jgi:transposase